MAVLNGPAQVAYRNFNSNDGLPSNEVYCAFQDHDGFMWFATDHGIVRYNGYDFKTYTTADGLTDNTVLDIKGDDNNRIWALTLSGGMCYFDGKKFSPHPNNDTIKSLFARQLPTSWQITQNNQLWLGFVDIGFYKIYNNTVEALSGEIASCAGDSMHIYILSIGSKYVYTNLYSHKMLPIKRQDVSDFTELTVSHYAMGSPNLNFTLLKLADSSFVVGQWHMLLHINKQHNVAICNWPLNEHFLKCKLSADGKVWIANKNRPLYALGFNNDLIQFKDSLTFTTSASDILLDSQGNYWITSLNKGIFLVPNAKIRIFSSPKVSADTKISGIISNSIHLYATLPESKLLAVDTNMQSSVLEPPVKNPGPLASISFRSDGTLLTNQDTSLSWFMNTKNYITRIIEVGKSKYLSGENNQLSLIDHNKVVYNSKTAGPAKRITEICKLSEQEYLVGTLSGLYYFECGSGYSIKKEPYFGNVRITAARLLKPGIYGVATRGNGVVLNIHGRFYSITEKQGIASNLAEDIYFENDSVLWEATFNGISKIYFRVQADSLVIRTKNYTREDGLCSNQINSITSFNGKLWLATNEGLCYFNVADLSEKTIQVPLFFGNISVNGTKLQADSLQLNYNQNNVFIGFNALYFKASGDIRYKLRLNGEETWKYTNLNYIQYFGLPPGKYVLEVAACSPDNKYTSAIHSFGFVIKPRFIDTVFFKGLVTVLILLILSLILYSIWGYQKLKSTNVIKLLQSEFKALSYQINPHFIFNVLNSIQYYIIKRETNNAVHLLGSFSLLIRRIINNSKQPYISIIEEVECLKEYLELEKMRLDNKFEYTINIDSSIDVEEKNIIPMIIQPMVENSIWHGIVPSLNKGTISIDFSKVNGTLICKVEDNGIGINKAVKKEKSQNNLSLAMKNVSERLKIISELNNSTWAINTIDKSVNDPTLSGTIVTIIFPSANSDN